MRAPPSPGAIGLSAFRARRRRDARKGQRCRPDVVDAEREVHDNAQAQFWARFWVAFWLAELRKKQSAQVLRHRHGRRRAERFDGDARQRSRLSQGLSACAFWTCWVYDHARHWWRQAAECLAEGWVTDDWREEPQARSLSVGAAPVALQVAVWPGRKRWHFRKLMRVIARNCGCSDGAPACPSHAMLYDPKTLQHLAFVKEVQELTDRLRIEEWLGNPPPR